MKAMILAAGRGKRMGSLTKCLPKPLLKIGKYTLIEYQLLSLAKHGFHEVVINVSYLAQQIMAYLGNGKKYGISIHYSIEEATALDTGGGIFNALSLLGKDPFLVVSADIWTNYPYHELKKTTNNLVHLVLVDNPPYHERGDFHLQGSALSVSDGTRLTYGNIGVYHPELFAHCSPGLFPLAPLIVSAIQANKASGEHYQGDWINVGTPEILLSLQSKFESDG